MSGKIQLYVGIDFGTARSGFAYGKVLNNSELKVKVNNRWERSEGQYKNITAILYENDRPLYWGQEAVEEYKHYRDRSEYDLVVEPKLELMKLPSCSITTADITTVRSQRKQLLGVVGDFLMLMKETILTILEEDNEPTDLSVIKWCVTVPAIWDDKMKKFMREACILAKIILPEYDDENHFVFALEPEAASVYCTLSDNFNMGGGGSTLPLIKFMVVDCGGGTIDITSFERNPSTNEMSQLSVSSGSAAGGKFVDKEFYKFLENNLTSQGRNQLKKSPDLTILMEHWETQKQRYKPDERRPKKMFLSIPNSISLIFKTCGNIVNNCFTSSDYHELVLGQNLILSLFEPSVSKTLEEIDKAFSLLPNRQLDGIIVVGGYADCPILTQRIKQKYSNTRVFIPNKCGEAVVHGAVLFSHQPCITSRCVRFTYGLEVSAPFDPLIHSEYHKTVNGDFSKGFHKILSIGDKVKPGQVITEETSAPRNSDKMALSIYKTEQKDATTLEPGMVMVMQYIVPIHKSLIQEPIKLKFDFGRTELVVTCTYKSVDWPGTCSFE